MWAIKHMKYRKANLKTLDGAQTFPAYDLWREKGAIFMAIRRPGCLLCRKFASELSNLKPQMAEIGLPLYGFVHENVPGEVDEFQTYLKANDVFWDHDKTFFHDGSLIPWFLNPAVLQRIRAAKKEGFVGSNKGENGGIHSAFYIVAPYSGGILFEHPEKEYGDFPDTELIRAILQEFKDLPSVFKEVKDSLIYATQQ